MSAFSFVSALLAWLSQRRSASKQARRRFRCRFLIIRFYSMEKKHDCYVRLDSPLFTGLAWLGLAWLGC